MPIQYRLLRPHEEAALIDLWLDVFPATDRAWWQHHLKAPHHQAHTFVAAAPDGTLVSSARYVPIFMHGADGTPQRVGHVQHVASRSTARNQGHAGHLMELVIDAMHRDGCAWSCLTADERNARLYTRYGYRALPRHYRAGLLAHAAPSASAYVIQRYNLAVAPQQWACMPAIYVAYNASRPLAVRRDTAYWHHLIAQHIPHWLDDHVPILFTAGLHTAPEQVVGYLLVHLANQQLAREAFGMDMIFTASEIGVLPEHEAALHPLAAAITTEGAGRRSAGRVWFPHEPAIDAALHALFGTTMQEAATDYSFMVRPIAAQVDHHDLDALVAVPHAWCWPLDVD